MVKYGLCQDVWTELLLPHSVDLRGIKGFKGLRIHNHPDHQIVAVGAVDAGGEKPNLMDSGHVCGRLEQSFDLLTEGWLVCNGVRKFYNDIVGHSSSNLVSVTADVNNGFITFYQFTFIPAVRNKTEYDKGCVSVACV